MVYLSKSEKWQPTSTLECHGSASASSKGQSHTGFSLALSMDATSQGSPQTQPSYTSKGFPIALPKSIGCSYSKQGTRHLANYRFHAFHFATWQITMGASCSCARCNNNFALSLARQCDAHTIEEGALVGVQSLNLSIHGSSDKCNTDQ